MANDNVCPWRHPKRSFGTFSRIFSCPIGIDAYNATEFKAIAKALELLCSTSFHPHIGSHFLVESYSIAAISLAQNLDSSPWHLSQVANSNASSLSLLPKVKFCHTLRNGKSIAGSLDKQGVNRYEDFVAFH